MKSPKTPNKKDKGIKVQQKKTTNNVVQKEGNKKLTDYLKKIGYPNLAKLLTPINVQTTARLKA